MPAEIRADLLRLKRDTESGRAVALGALAGNLGGPQDTPNKPSLGPRLSQRWSVDAASKTVDPACPGCRLATVGIAFLTFRLMVPLPPPKSRVMSRSRMTEGQNLAWF